MKLTPEQEANRVRLIAAELLGWDPDHLSASMKALLDRYYEPWMTPRRLVQTVREAEPDNIYLARG